MPPEASDFRLTPEQAQYYFVNGYTSKLAGTEAGVTEPVPNFSPCFGGPFMLALQCSMPDARGPDRGTWHQSLAFEHRLEWWRLRRWFPIPAAAHPGHGACHLGWILGQRLVKLIRFSGC